MFSGGAAGSGNVTLTGVSVTDPLTGQSVTGATLAPGAQQSFNSSYTLTQDDLNRAGNAGSDGDIDNMLTFLAASTRGIVNIPPRHLKTELFSISLTAWMLGHNAALKIAGAANHHFAAPAKAPGDH